jgi:hypothetical protein
VPRLQRGKASRNQARRFTSGYLLFAASRRIRTSKHPLRQVNNSRSINHKSCLFNYKSCNIFLFVCFSPDAVVLPHGTGSTLLNFGQRLRCKSKSGLCLRAEFLTLKRKKYRYATQYGNAVCIGSQFRKVF